MDLHTAHYLDNLYNFYNPWLSHCPPALRLTGASPLLALRHAPVEPKRRHHTRHFIDDILADASDARSKHCDASGRTDARHSSECKPNEERTDCWSHEDVRHTSPVSSPDSASRLNSTCGSDVTPTREKKKKARTTFTGRQIYELEQKFEAKKYLTAAERSELAASLKVTETQVCYLHVVFTFSFTYYLYIRRKILR